MKKFFVFILIFSLIVVTSLIKNSTKELDDEIYSLNENIRFLENRLEDTKLEYDYLSSSEKFSALVLLAAYTTAIWLPFFAKAKQILWPRPPLPPVTIETVPRKSIVLILRVLLDRVCYCDCSIVISNEGAFPVE